MPNVHRQLALPFVAVAPRLRADDFLAAPSNEAARRWLCDTAAWPLRRLALSGATGAGKTHLLQCWAERHDAMLLDGACLRGMVHGSAAIAIDDADLAPVSEALLHLLNDAAERQYPVLLAGRLPASRWPVVLPDLRSRLRATVSVELGQPDDALLRALLARLLAERQLAVSAAVQDWLLLRLPRNGADLREAAARLDRAALAAGRGVSRSLAAEIVRSFAPDEASIRPDDWDSRTGPDLL